MKVLAIDLGSSSARIMSVDDSYRVTELDRFSHAPVFIDGHYRFDTASLFDKILHAIDEAIDGDSDIKSIGICSWGVDYGLIDGDGKIVDLPISYRDGRTENIFSKRDKRKDFLTSGIFPLAINTVYQLLDDVQSGRIKDGYRMAMIADLLAFKLTGNVRAELTNASTTGLLLPDATGWNYAFIDALGIPRSIFPEIIDSGDCYGDYRGIRVTAVPSHDTAAAVLAMGDFDIDTAFISSGSWVLLGALADSPIITDSAFRAGFTNERGYGNKVTFLKNANGLYVVQRIAAETGLSYKEIDETIETAKSLGLLDMDALNSPDDMRGEIEKQLKIKNSRPIDLVRTAYDSIADALRKGIDELSVVTGRHISKVKITGGMTRAPYLMKKLSETGGVEFTAVSGEGAVLGNAVAQFKTLLK